MMPSTLRFSSSPPLSAMLTQPSAASISPRTLPSLPLALQLLPLART